MQRWLAASLAIAPVALGWGCARRGLETPGSTPTPQVVTVPAAAPPASVDASAAAVDAPTVAASALGLPRAAPSLGHFRVALRLEAEADAWCPPMLSDVAVPADDEAWLVGSCSIRLHYVRGYFEQERPRSIAKPSMGAEKCAAYSSFISVLARSRDEVYVTGTLNCGLDPSYVWLRDLERWDGSRWRTLPSAYLHKDPHDSAPSRLAAGKTGPLYCIGSGDDWHGVPKDGVYEHGPTGWGKPLRFGLPRDYPLGAPPLDWSATTLTESYAAIAVADSGAVWVIGERRPAVADATGERPAQAGLALRREGRKWSEQTIDDKRLADLSIGSDGSVWAAGSRLWQLSGDAWREIVLGVGGDYEIRSVWAHTAKDVWLVVSGTDQVGSSEHVVHFDGERAVEVPFELDGEEDQPERVRGNGEAVWIIGRSRAYLRAPGAQGDAGAAAVILVKPD